MNRMSAWWSSLGFGRATAPVDDDYADMGTAFGLDASMDTVPSSYTPSATTPEVQAAPWMAGSAASLRR